MLSVKECPSQSSLHELKILLDKEVSKDHLPYIRAYE